MPITIPAPYEGEILCLSHLKKGDSASVIGMLDGPGADHAALKRRLLELGFVEGEVIVGAVAHRGWKSLGKCKICQCLRELRRMWKWRGAAKETPEQHYG